MRIPLLGKVGGLVAVLTLAAACAPAASPAPTAAPSKPAAATQPPAAPTKPAAAAPTAAAGAPATQPAAGSLPWEMPGAGLIKGPRDGEARQLTGAGATFPAPLYTKWFEEYNKLTGVQVNYQSIGSGGGIKAITDGTADFAGSDAVMTAEQLNAAKGEILHVPMTLGAVVATYNLPGLENTKLKFTGETLAAIFLGEISKWNDPKLAADNPGVSLPDRDIAVVHRSDGSGTTFIFTDYLSAVSENWKTNVGKSTSVNWPTGIGAKGNEGVAGEIKQNPYSIGYVEYAYAYQNRLPVGSIQNSAGQFVEPTLETTTAAAAGVASSAPADLKISIVNPPGEAAYPIASFTWLLVRKEQSDQAKATALTRMMWWATHDAQRFSADLHYAPLPAAIVEKVEAEIKSITVNGQPAFPER